MTKKNACIGYNASSSNGSALFPPGQEEVYRGELGWMPIMTLVERNMQLRESCTLEQAVGKLDLWEAIRSFQLTVCKTVLK